MLAAHVITCQPTTQSMPGRGEPQLESDSPGSGEAAGDDDGLQPSSNCDQLYLSGDQNHDDGKWKELYSHDDQSGTFDNKGESLDDEGGSLDDPLDEQAVGVAPLDMVSQSR